MSLYDLENIKCLLATTKEEKQLDHDRVLFEITSSWNQEGVHQPGMVGI